jgi:hypothetical protein
MSSLHNTSLHINDDRSKEGTMPYEKVIAMTDTELRIKVAELLGAKWYVDREYPEDGRFLAFGQASGWDKAKGDEPTNNSLWFIPDYPNNKIAAWELWDKMPCDRCIGLYTNIEGEKCVGIHWELDDDRIFRYLNNVEGIDPKDRAKWMTRAFVIAKTEEVE